MDTLADALDARSDAPALADGSRRWSYRELAAEADGLGGRLGPAAGEAGSVVATVFPPSAAGIVAIHAVLRAGAVVAPLNPKLTAHEMSGAFGVLGPAAILTAPELQGRVRTAAAAAGLALDTAPPPAPRVPAAGAAPGSTSVLLPERVRSPTLGDVEGAAAVVWTSGTAGSPRGVVLGERALRHVAAASGERLGLAPDDRWYASLSPAHVGGLALVVRAALLGSSVEAGGSADMSTLAARMDSGAVTHASLVPVLLRRLLDAHGAHGDGRAPPGLRALLVGGAAAARPLVERATALGYPVALTYGLTEATSQVATAPPALVRRKPGTVGAPLPGVEVLIAADGEILVRGPTLALGTIGPDGVALLAEGGWLRTGDLGERDDEGHLWITGRRSERIVTGGVTVDPGEVEAVLTAHPDVRDACVVGLPDAEWGERVAAVVVLARGAPSRLDDIEALCRERLTSPKVPRRIRAVPRLPRNPNGKVDRDEVRSLLG